MNFSNVYMQELATAWKMVAKTMTGTSPQDLENSRVNFYMGALTVHAIINNASKLPENLATKVVDSLDREIDSFKVEMHERAQKEADRARAKEISEIGGGA